MSYDYNKRHGEAAGLTPADFAMTQAEQELARAVSEHPRWEWREAIALRRIGRVGQNRVLVPGPRPDCYPDLTDAATCGVLLAMLAGCGKVDLMIWSTGVSIDPGDSGNFTDARLGVALARALLAAWGA